MGKKHFKKREVEGKKLGEREEKQVEDGEWKRHVMGAKGKGKTMET